MCFLAFQGFMLYFDEYFDVLVLYFEVFELLNVTWKPCTKMSTMMNLHFLELMEAYHCLAV